MSEDRLLDALAGLPGGGTGQQVAIALHLSGPTATRSVGVALRALVAQGRVLEVRPGRYQVSGAGGEHAVVLAEGPKGSLIAKLSDGREWPVHARHTLGARSGDVCQALLSEDEHALVTRILRRAGRALVGNVVYRPGGMTFVPDNRREGDLPVHSVFTGFEKRYQAGARVQGVLEVDGDGGTGVTITRILEDASPEVADFTHTCLMHDLPGEFPKVVEDEAGAFPTELAVAGREDLRDRLIFTIDPETAKDFDDAISLEPRAEGGWTLGVHIADVSHYVREDSQLDAEAANRGTSIYLINRVIPMLPEVLSNGMCSLVPRQDRYCLSAFLSLDEHFRLVGTRMAETVIHSKQRLSYEQALAVLEDRAPAGAFSAELVEVIKRTSSIAQAIRKMRERAGALNLYSVEHRFTLDAEGMPILVHPEQGDIAHQLIEECMLLANRAVATWIEERGFPCVYRIHAPPDTERMAQFATVLEATGIDATGVNDRFGLQRVLKRLEDETKATRLVLNFMCLRSFKKAVYAVENIGHYALAFERYCHFTSPIRRYPDLLVHRLVKRGLELEGYRTVEVRRDYLDALARQSSWLEQRAELGERTIHARKSARYLGQRLGEPFPAVVTGAMGGGLFVQLLETGMEGMLPVRELGDDYYEYDPEVLALVGTRSGRTFGPGVELDVVVSSVDIDRSEVSLSLAPATATGEAKPAHSQSIGADLARLSGHRKTRHRQEQEKRGAERTKKVSAKEDRRQTKRSDGPKRHSKGR